MDLTLEELNEILNSLKGDNPEDFLALSSLLYKVHREVKRRELLTIQPLKDYDESYS